MTSFVIWTVRVFSLEQCAEHALPTLGGMAFDFGTRTIHRKELSMTTNGTIKRLNEKGFGFIATAEGTEYFFHQSACAGTPFDQLREGQTVSFPVGQGPKGPRAENVNVR